MRRDINFFSVYRAPADGELTNKFNLIALSVIAGAFVIVLGIFSVIKIADLATISTTNAHNAYLQTSEVLKAEKIINRTTAKLAALNQYIQAADRVSTGYASMPKLTTAQLASIARKEPSDVNVSALSYASGSLTLTCTATGANSAAYFVHALQNSKEFSNVNYPGVAKGADTGTGKSGYSFTVQIMFKGGTSK